MMETMRESWGLLADHPGEQKKKKKEEKENKRNRTRKRKRKGKERKRKSKKKKSTLRLTYPSSNQSIIIPPKRPLSP